MSTTRVASLAVGILLVAVAWAIIVPALAGMLVASRLSDQLTIEFGAPVEASVDVASVPSLFGGRLASVLITVATHDVEADGRAIRLESAVVSLTDVEVDLGAAAGGSVEEVEVGRGRLEARISSATLEGLLRDGLERERPDLGPMTVEVVGANVVIPVAGPEGTALVVEARPALVGQEIQLVPVGVSPDDPSATLADAIAGLGAALPSLPLGLRFDEMVVSPEGVVLRGDVPSTLRLS